MGDPHVRRQPRAAVAAAVPRRRARAALSRRRARPGAHLRGPCGPAHPRCRRAPPRGRAWDLPVLAPVSRAALRRDHGGLVIEALIRSLGFAQETRSRLLDSLVAAKPLLAQWNS